MGRQKASVIDKRERAVQRQISINFPMEHQEAKEAYDYIMALYPVERSRYVRECLYIGIRLSKKFGPSWIQEGDTLIDGKLSLQDEIRQFKKDIINSLKGIRIIDIDGQEKDVDAVVVSELDLGDLSGEF